mmetsp:Transcript_103756/g.231729  ORF Transcript_103756/g.231729 Transcript_103756/m.231729 type:complete len:251 (+) Transcript_103756:1493-2245(+)
MIGPEFHLLFRRKLPEAPRAMMARIQAALCAAIILLDARDGEIAALRRTSSRIGPFLLLLLRKGLRYSDPVILPVLHLRDFLLFLLQLLEVSLLLIALLLCYLVLHILAAHRVDLILIILFLHLFLLCMGRGATVRWAEQALFLPEVALVLLPLATHLILPDPVEFLTLQGLHFSAATRRSYTPLLLRSFLLLLRSCTPLCLLPLAPPCRVPLSHKLLPLPVLLLDQPSSLIEFVSVLRVQVVKVHDAST